MPEPTGAPPDSTVVVAAPAADTKAIAWTPVLVATTLGIFILAGLAEIGGGWLVWQKIREHKPWYYLLAGEPRGSTKPSSLYVTHSGNTTMGPAMRSYLPCGCLQALPSCAATAWSQPYSRQRPPLPECMPYTAAYSSSCHTPGAGLWTATGQMQGMAWARPLCWQALWWLGSGQGTRLTQHSSRGANPCTQRLEELWLVHLHHGTGQAV
jgi:hypothetical protein